MAMKQEIAEKLMNARGIVSAASFSEIPQGFAALVNDAEGPKLAVVCESWSEANKAWKGSELEPTEFKDILVGMFPLNSNNAALLRRLVRWTAPSSCGTGGVSLGFSDWLGITSAQLPNLFLNKQVKPVLVEYTPENCRVLDRTFLDAIDVATWTIFASGYKKGYAAMASGLKSEEDIVKALLYGYSGIGVDCAGKLDCEADKLSDEEVEKRFGQLDPDFREAIDKSYLGVELEVASGDKITFKKADLHRMVLVFGQAIMYAQNMYKTYLQDTPWDLDFEIDFSNSDKMMCPCEHYFLANELKRSGVKFDTLCVNVTYVKPELEKNLEVHAGIAKSFDYRLSFVDTSLVYDDLSDLADGFNRKVNFRLNNVLWLSALQTIADTDKSLMRKIAERAGLPLPTVEDLVPSEPLGQSYATSYDKILSKKEGVPELPVRRIVERNKGMYETYLKKQIRRYLDSL